MSAHNATVRWFASPGEEFVKGHYSRVHSWSFDGGAVVEASASPHVVPAPWSDPGMVDPEEAFVASISSCHMLFFLDFARHSGTVVMSYEDEADGAMAKGADGKIRIVRITLRPRVTFGPAAPDAAEIEALHHRAHEACFMANSTTAEIVVEPR